jgi:hypothetical protein
MLLNSTTPPGGGLNLSDHRKGILITLVAVLILSPDALLAMGFVVYPFSIVRLQATFSYGKTPARVVLKVDPRSLFSDSNCRWRSPFAICSTRSL